MSFAGSADLDLGAGAGAGRTLTFTAANWNIAQNVSVTAVNDAVAEGPETANLAVTVGSTDAAYAGLSVPTLSVSVADNDTAGVTISPYSGPVSFLQWQIFGTPEQDIIGGTAGNDFIPGFGGDDAIDGGAGDDVIDGGTGSNFLVGGTGRDTFFLDARNPTVPTWSTIADWEAGEELALWGWRNGVSRSIWADEDGAPGFRGRTLHADIDGNGAIETSITWAGRSAAQVPVPNLSFPDLAWFV